MLLCDTQSRNTLRAVCFFKAHLLHQLIGALNHSLAVQPSTLFQLFAEKNIFGDAKRGYKVELLIDGANAGFQCVTCTCQGHLLTIYINISCRGSVYAAEHFDQRAFSCTIFSHQSMYFPCMQIKMHVF